MLEYGDAQSFGDATISIQRSKSTASDDGFTQKKTRQTLGRMSGRAWSHPLATWYEHAPDGDKLGAQIH